MLCYRWIWSYFAIWRLIFRYKYEKNKNSWLLKKICQAIQLCIIWSKRYICTLRSTNCQKGIEFSDKVCERIGLLFYVCINVWQVYKLYYLPTRWNNIGLIQRSIYQIVWGIVYGYKVVNAVSNFSNLAPKCLISIVPIMLIKL